MPRPYKGTWEATAQVRSRIVELYDLGWSAQHIGKEVGLSTSTIYYHLRVAGRRRRGRHHRTGPLGYTPHREIQRTIELYEAGFSCRTVGVIQGLSHATIRYRLMGAGIPMRNPHRNNL